MGTSPLCSMGKTAMSWTSPHHSHFHRASSVSALQWDTLILGKASEKSHSGGKAPSYSSSITTTLLHWLSRTNTER
jgi:hypothetical protein